MTDEESRDETKKPKRMVIRYRSADGEWNEMPVKRRRTGDPELDAIWRMSFGELEEILDNESHPLHEKAKQVSAEMVKPIMDAANEIMRPITDSIAKRIDTSKMVEALMPKLDFEQLIPVIDRSSWAAKLLPEMPKSEVPRGLMDSITAARRIEPVRSPQLLTVPMIDFDATEPPDASLVEIQEAAEARAHEMRNKQVEILTDLLVETRASAESGMKALTVSEQALGETRSSKRAGWTAAWAAIGAGVISAVGILVTVLVGR